MEISRKVKCQQDHYLDQDYQVSGFPVFRFGKDFQRVLIIYEHGGQYSRRTGTI